jgi:hypothetical protein
MGNGGGAEARIGVGWLCVWPSLGQEHCDDCSEIVGNGARRGHGGPRRHYRGAWDMQRAGAV